VLDARRTMTPLPLLLPPPPLQLLLLLLLLLRFGALQSDTSAPVDGAAVSAGTG